jgi:hypothetical protein
VVGEPFEVPADATDEQLRSAREYLERTLTALEARALELVRSPRPA